MDVIVELFQHNLKKTLFPEHILCPPSVDRAALLKLRDVIVFVG